MRILAIGNHKGGVGKTATAHNLGAELARRGRRVLLVDVDPQAGLTAACGVDGDTGGNLADVIRGGVAMSAILRELRPGLWLAPATLALANAELGLATHRGRENVIRGALADVAARYDMALLDTHPGLGLLTVAALVAAEAVIIPTQPQGADLRALALFLQTVDGVRGLNPALQVLGILPTFYDRRLSHHGAALAALQGAGLPVIPVTIGRTVRIAEAMAAGLPLAEYDPHNPQAAAYADLAEYVQSWLESNPT
jgi:chromosome partitioning protein